MKLIIVALIFVLGVQLGIHHGRSLEQAEIQPILATGIAKVEATQAEVAKYRLMLEIIACESGFDTHAVGDGGKSVGIAQFHKDTFYSMAKQAGYKGQWKDAKDQIAVLKWAVEHGEEGAWSCPK